MYSILQGFEKGKHKITRVNEGLRDARIVCSRPASARRKITRPRERVARAPRAPSTRARASRAPGNDESDIRIERSRRGRRRRRRNRVSCENPRTRLATTAPSLGPRRKSQTPRPSSSIGGLRSRERHRAKNSRSPTRRSPVRRSRVSSRSCLGKTVSPVGTFRGRVHSDADSTGRASRGSGSPNSSVTRHMTRDRARPRAVWLCACSCLEVDLTSLG